MTYYQYECQDCDRFAISMRDRQTASYWATMHADEQGCSNIEWRGVFDR